MFVSACTLITTGIALLTFGTGGVEAESTVLISQSTAASGTTQRVSVFAWSRAPVTWWVDVQAAGPGDGSPQDPFPRIQDAIDAGTTISGDTVMVLPGVYAENVDYRGKGLSVVSTGGPDVTVVDGSFAGSVVVLRGGEGPGTRLEGFTLTHGASFQGILHGDGGGIYCDGCLLVVENCRLDECSSNSAPLGTVPSRGGGIFARDATLDLVNVEILNNVRGQDPSYGTGVFAEDSTLSLTDCSIHSNEFAEYGSGVCLIDSDAVLQATSISDHDLLSSFTRGGGLYAFGSGNTVSMDSCSIERNRGQWFNSGDRGGGLYLEGITAEIRNSSISDNLSGGWLSGSGISSINSSLTLEDTTIVGNEDGYGAVRIDGGQATIAGCQFSGNTAYSNGGALFLSTGASVQVSNSVFGGNTVSWECGAGGALYVWSGTLDVTDSLFVNNSSGGHGGGAGDFPGGQTTFQDCSFLGNQIDWCYQSGAMTGGALRANGGAVTALRCLFANNEAPDGGGAVWGPAVLERCTLANNRSLSGSQSCGYCGGGAAHGAVLSNCIVYGNTPEQLAGGATGAWTLVEGGWPGVGNIDADPLFWLPQAGDYYLQPGSPAIDAGDPFSPLDPDGSVADMGAYPYDPGHAPAGIASYCEEKQSSEGCQPAIAWTGSPTLSGPDDFHLRATAVPALRAGLLFWGLTPVAMPFKGGTLCVVPLARTPIQWSFGTVSCSGQFDYFMTQSYLQSKSITAGTPVFTQYWFRDPGYLPPNDIGLTDGLGFVVQ